MKKKKQISNPNLSNFSIFCDRKKKKSTTSNIFLCENFDSSINMVESINLPKKKNVSTESNDISSSINSSNQFSINRFRLPKLSSSPLEIEKISTNLIENNKKFSIFSQKNNIVFFKLRLLFFYRNFEVKSSKIDD